MKGIRKFLPSMKKKSSPCKDVEEAPVSRGSGQAEAQSSGVHGAGAELTPTGAAGGGSLNPRQQLEAAYAKLFKNDGAEDAWKKEFFQKVRILVLGRSGAGKTTLIRLMVGKDGPQTVSEGVAGVQNINEEFLYSSEEQGVPLIIHDSNGMDVKGKERVIEIKNFLDKHQKGENDFTERIHIVWYVINAIDSRCVDDGDVMKLISEYKIPLLLIMTHSDYEKVKVTDDVLNLLLQTGYPDSDARESVKKMMVRVCNDGVSLGASKELVIDETKQDMEGLKMVAKRTQQLMDKNLRLTWIAAQAVDTDGKLDESAGIIAGSARRALFTSLPRVIPFSDPLKLTIIFYRMIVVMCRIWVVPPQLNKALMETLMHKEASCRVLRRLGQDLVYVAGLVVTVGATVATAGAALPSVIAVLSASGILHVGKAVPVLVKTFALQVLGTILYVKSAQAGSSKQRWKPGVSKEEYVALCEEFAHNADHQSLLLNFAKRQHSLLDTALRKKKVQGMMKSKIVEMYRRLLRDRPNSLFSLIAKERPSPAGAPKKRDLTATRASPKQRHQAPNSAFPKQRHQVPNNIERFIKTISISRRASIKSKQQRDRGPVNETVNDTNYCALAKFDQQHDQVHDNNETHCTSTKFDHQQDQVARNVETLDNTSDCTSTKFDQQCDQVHGNTEIVNNTTCIDTTGFDGQDEEVLVDDDISIGQDSEPLSSEEDDDSDDGDDDYDDEEMNF